MKLDGIKNESRRGDGFSVGVYYLSHQKKKIRFAIQIQNPRDESGDLKVSE
jgi:hypothetical protein